MPNTTSPPPVIVWFRQDLRLADHPALSAAADSGAPVLPLFILDDESAGPWAPGGASRWWLHGSLMALDAALRSRGSRLILRRGRTTEVLRQLAEEVSAAGVFFTRAYEPHLAAMEGAVADAFEVDGRGCRRFACNLLFEPEVVRSKAGAPFRVFTPFYKACLAQDGIRQPLPAPARLSAPANWPECDRLEAWALLPATPDWAGGAARDMAAGRSLGGRGPGRLPPARCGGLCG